MDGLSVQAAGADGLAVLLNATFTAGIAEGIAHLVGIGEDDGVGIVVEETYRLLVDTLRQDAQQQDVAYADMLADSRPGDIVLEHVDSGLLIVSGQLAHLRHGLGAS